MQTVTAVYRELVRPAEMTIGFYSSSSAEARPSEAEWMAIAISLGGRAVRPLPEEAGNEQQHVQPSYYLLLVGAAAENVCTETLLRELQTRLPGTFDNIPPSSNYRPEERQLKWDLDQSTLSPQRFLGDFSHTVTLINESSSSPVPLLRLGDVAMIRGHELNLLQHMYTVIKLNLLPGEQLDVQYSWWTTEERDTFAARHRWTEHDPIVV